MSVVAIYETEAPNCVCDKLPRPQNGEFRTNNRIHQLCTVQVAL